MNGRDYMGKVKSMTSRRRIPFPIDQRFGRLRVVSVSRHDPRRGSYFRHCLCDSGNAAEVREDCLKTGNTQSCGCLQPESVKALAKHGMWNTRTYRIWHGMKSRCNSDPADKKHHLYAGKGIRVCKRWAESFEAFFADMGEAPPGLSIERKNGNGDYCPENCCWATPKEQANNTSYNIRIKVNGKTQTVA